MEPTSKLKWHRRPILGPSILTGVFLAFAYLLTYSGVPHSPDDWFYLDGAQAILRGDLQGLQAHGWLFSVLETPFLWLSSRIPQLGGFQFPVLLSTLAPALTALLLAIYFYELLNERKLGLVSALIYGLGTLAWPYSRFLFREPTAACFLLLTFWLLDRFYRYQDKKALLLGGVAFWATVQIKGTMIAFLPFFLILVLWKPILRFVEGLPLPGGPASLLARSSASLRSLSPWKRILLFLLFDVALFVSVWVLALLHLPGVPHYFAQGINFYALAALLISPGWGLLIYAPVLIISLWGIPTLTRSHPEVAFIAIGGAFFYVLASTTNPFWWGYWSYGPRQLVPLIPLLMLPFPWGWNKLKQQGYGGVLGRNALLGISILIQMIGVFTPFNQYIRQELLPRHLTGPAITWEIAHWPVAGMARFLTASNLDIAWLRSGGGTERWVAFLVIALGVALTWGGLWQCAFSLSAKRHSRDSIAAGVVLALAWGTVAILAIRTVYADDRYHPELGYLAAAEKIKAQSRADDVLITDLWTENLEEPTVAMLNYCQGRCPKRIDLIRENLTDREEDWQTAHLVDLKGARRAWLVLTRVMEGDPNSIVEQWLDQVGYLASCEWTGPQVRLCLYSLPPGDSLKNWEEGVSFGDAIRLVGARVQRAPAYGGKRVWGGDTLQMELVWQARAPVEQDMVLSTQLIGPDGRLVNAFDWRPGNGFRPTPSWQPGETIGDRRALSIPDSAPPGEYHVLVIFYDATSGERVRVRTAAGAESDFLELLSFPVEASRP